jgi:CBS domain-containing protein
MAHVTQSGGEVVVESRDQPKSLIDVFGGFEASHAVFPLAARNEVVTLSPDDHVAHAFQTLAKEKLLAAPVVDASGTAVGVVSVLHFVSYFVRHFSAEELQGDDWNALVAKKNHLLGKRINEIPDLQALDKAHVIKEYQTAIDAVNLMIDDEDPARRVLVVDDNKKLVTVISQSRMLHLVSGVLDSLPDPANRTLRERNLHKKEVASIKLDQPAGDAFVLMREKEISGVAVVDDEQKLVGVISASDIKLLGFDLGYLHLLGKSARDYLTSLRGSIAESQRVVCTCDVDATIDHAVKQLIARHVHRLFVIDDQRKLVGVVSIRDILKTLLNPFEN